jgi:TolB protein
MRGPWAAGVYAERECGPGHSLVRRSFPSTMSCAAAALVGGLLATPAFASVTYLALTEQTWQVFLIDPNGRNPRRLTRGTNDIARLTCSTSGEVLASTNQGAAQLIDQKSGAVTPIPIDARMVLDAAISPDGKQVAFSFSRAESVDANDIYIVGVDGQGLRKVFGLPALQHEPAWSRDGRWIYFASGDGGSVHDLWRVALDKGTGEQLTVGARYNFDVATGPNDTFVFSSNRSGDYELWMASPNKNPTRLTDHPGLDARPSFSPDGKHIVYERVDNGVSNIWKLRIGSKKPEQLTKTADGARGPVWCGS